MLLGGKSYAFAEHQQYFLTLTDFTLERERYCLPDRACCFSCLVVLIVWLSCCFSCLVVWFVLLFSCFVILLFCWMTILLEVTTNN